MTLGWSIKCIECRQVYDIENAHNLLFFTSFRRLDQVSLSNVVESVINLQHFISLFEVKSFDSEIFIDMAIHYNPEIRTSLPLIPFFEVRNFFSVHVLSVHRLACSML